MAASSVVASTGAGMAAGTAVAPGWGTVIGGVIGLGAGLLSAWEEADNEEQKRKILDEASRKLNVSQDAILNKLNEYYDTHESIGRQKDISNYRKLVDNYDPNEFVYKDKDTNGDGIPDSLGEFEYKQSIDDFYTPNREAIIQKTSDQLQSTAAGAGIGRGTGAANQIATGVANKNEELYKDALQAYNQDRQFAYQIWNSNIQNQQNRLDRLKAGLDTQLGLYGNLAQDYNNYQQQKAQTYMDLEKERMNNELQLTLASI